MTVGGKLLFNCLLLKLTKGTFCINIKIQPLERNAQTFLDVVDSHKGIIYKISRAYCRKEADRQDLVQEIILQLWFSFNKYDEQFALSTWIYRIALNVSISYLRKEYRRHAINHDLPVDVLSLQGEAGPPGTDTEVEQLYVHIRELKVFDRALILLYLEGKRQQEIAEILGLTPSNVSTRVFRIKQQLKQKISNHKK